MSVWKPIPDDEYYICEYDEADERHDRHGKCLKGGVATHRAVDDSGFQAFACDYHAENDASLGALSTTEKS